MAKGMLSLIVGVCFAQSLYAVDNSTQRIDRYGLVNRHNVVLDSFDKMPPMSVGNGKFDSASHVFERDVILSMMLKANAYQQTHPVMKENDRNWQRGTWYTGVMAAYRATGDVRFLQQAMEWGRQHAWQVGTERYGANKLFCVQTWLELYSLKKDKAMIQPAIDHLASDQPNSPGGAKRWYLEGDH
ncbi:MAG: glycoside hydrolase family 88 protein, partial [Planctomycetota bacterium]